MTVALEQINSTGLRVFMGTLTDGVDVPAALVEVARRQNIQAGTVDLLGGLTEVELTAYDFATQTRQPPLTFKRALEIVAGHGTLSLLEGEPSFHLHLACAFRDPAQPHGIAMIGGHAARAIAFAVEFALTAFDGVPVHRALHAGTGLKLWNLPPLPLGEGPALNLPKGSGVRAA
jgi:predicted DNA-binding protein with PD1-like motif